MKKLLLFVVIFLSSLFYSQTRIGFSYNQIYNEFRKNGIKRDYIGDDKILTFTTEATMVFYFFNERDVCYKTTFMPVNEDFFVAMIEYYNKNYVIVSDTKWKMYTQNGVLNISLDYFGKTPIFTWKK